MIPLYTEVEYINAKSMDFLKLQCNHCNKEFLIIKKLITQELNHNRGRCKFCNTKCLSAHQKTSILVKCTQCDISINRQLCTLYKNNIKINNIFCSNSCAAIYNNTHKTTGNRRSKLEIYLEEQLSVLYPNLKILFNDKTAINSELDIYIPSFKLAFELNGIFHYEPIFGQVKFNQIINNDTRKFAACNENNISLCIIDSSQQKRFTEKSSLIYLNIIINIINERLFLI